MKIRISYDDMVSEIMGSEKDELEMPRRMTIVDALNYVIGSRPEIMDIFPPGILSILVDGRSPEIYDELDDGAHVKFFIAENERIKLAQNLLSDEGKTGFVSITDDPSGPEGKAVHDYVKWHKRLPPDYADFSEEEIGRMSRVLIEGKTSAKKWKDTVMILAHHPSSTALQMLNVLKDENRDAALWKQVWLDQALQECRAFNKMKATGKSEGAVIMKVKTGRNDPCPCGSGKKFKRCCGG